MKKKKSIEASIVKIRRKTVADFGVQWSHFTQSEGLYGEPEFLEDIFGPLVKTEEIKGKHILDIGSGTGRICEMLLKNRAAFVYGLEPSKKAFSEMEKNLKSFDNFSGINVFGDQIPSNLELDIITSIGVIHHIKDPLSTLESARMALKKNGKLIIWVYGKEGNVLYLLFYKSISWITKRLSHNSLLRLSKCLRVPLNIYGLMCKKFPLPMSDYFKKVINNWTEDVKILTIYDQLNPHYSKYYSEIEIKKVVESAGFENIRTYHRHGFSWTVTAIKRCVY